MDEGPPTRRPIGWSTAPLVDPRLGDAEDDASSTKTRSLISIAGSLLAEVSLPKLAIAWAGLVLLPGLALGLAPLAITAWLGLVPRRIDDWSSGWWWPIALLLVAAVVALLAGRPLLRLAERSFWSLNAVAVQPLYALIREAFRHFGSQLSGRATALAAGIVVCVASALVALAAWPCTRWVGAMADFIHPVHLVAPALANAVVVIAGYCAVAALAWGIADAATPQPEDHPGFDTPPAGARHWRVAHLSDLHAVGEPYGFRIESGRAGPRGNERLRATLAALAEAHAAEPVDVVLLSGDMTDAGRSAEWAAFLDELAAFPDIAERALMIPGNHDVNVVDRANPARLDLPTSPSKRLRQMRTLAVLGMTQGDRVRLVERSHGLGGTLTAELEPHRAAIAAFCDRTSLRSALALSQVWPAAFPMIVEPTTPDGLGVVLLDSNADTHFSFTNALGMVTAEQERALSAVLDAYPRAAWVVALHHHLVEYPTPAEAFSERVGTALINGTWFVRKLLRHRNRIVVMHGHRHIDWIGACGGLPIISAPSAVMNDPVEGVTSFLIHRFAWDNGTARLSLCAPQRVLVRADDRVTRAGR